MLRNDGSYTIYVISHNYGKRDPRFRQSSLDHFGYNEKKSDSPKLSLSASGECWQKTGIHGTFDLNHAKKLAKRIAKKNTREDIKFAVQEIVIFQKTFTIFKA